MSDPVRARVYLCLADLWLALAQQAATVAGTSYMNAAKDWEELARRCSARAVRYARLAAEQEKP